MKNRKRMAHFVMSFLLSFVMVVNYSAPYVVLAQDELADVPQPDSATDTSDETEPVLSEPAVAADEESESNALDSSNADLEEDPTALMPPEATASTETAKPLEEDAQQLTRVYVSATSGDDQNDGRTPESAVKSLEQGLKLLTSGGEVYITGAFDLSQPVSIPANVHVVAYENTTMSTTSNINGLTLSSGSTLSTINGATLTMTGFKYAIVVNEGAILQDGNYVMSDVTRGIYLLGSIQGSSRNALNIQITAASGQEGFLAENNSRIQSATLVVHADQAYSHPSVRGYTPLANTSLNASDASLSFYNYNLGIYVGRSMNLDGCDFYINNLFQDPESSWDIAMKIQVAASVNINNSNMTVEGGRLNITSTNLVNFNNSTITIKNANAGYRDSGGININWGTAVNFNNTVLRSNVAYGQFMVIGKDGTNPVTFRGSSRIETSQGQYDHVGKMGGGAEYVVLGGSYKLPNIIDSRELPTNGNDNGNETLTLFTLTDPSRTELQPINKNGAAYTYPVANANDDGQKRVFVPASSVTFRLNNNSATFSDGTTQDKTLKTIRGYSIQDVVGNDIPQSPKGDAEFLGWYYLDDDGKEQPFTNTTIAKHDLVVFAKWKGNIVRYHGSDGAVADFIYDNTKTSATVQSYEDVTSTYASFANDSQNFSYWSLDAQGNDKIEAGDTLTFGDKDIIDIYGQFNEKKVSVSFLANGGYFADDSYFKTSGKFDITTDANGSEIATLKEKVKYDTSLEEAVGAGVDQLVPTRDRIKRPGYVLESERYWYGLNGLKNLDTTGTVFFGYRLTDPDNPVLKTDAQYIVEWKVDSNAVLKLSDASMDADLQQSAGDWQTSNKAPVVAHGSKVNINGYLDFTKVQKAIDELAAKYEDTASTRSAAVLENVELKNVDFTVQWKLTLPEGASADTKNITIDDSIFEVESINQDGQILTVVLKPKTNFTNLQQLADAVHTHKDSLDVTFASIQLGQKKDTAAKNYTFVGTPSISLNADVFNGDQVNVVQYNWNPTQKADAADPENGSAISYTYKTPTRTVLLGDLRIGEDTQHEAITEIDPQDTHAIYGDLNVEPIQHAVESMNTSHGGSVGNPVDDVALENMDSSFTAELSFPDQMRLASNLESSISLEGANGVFEIKNVEKLADRNAITVSIALKDARNYDNFADLYKQVMSVAPKLTVKVDGVEVDAGSVSKGDLLHMEGTLEGTFYAKATRNSKTEEYAYQWVAIQDPLGTDANQDSSDTQTIGLTLKVKQATPEKIEQEFTLNGDLLLDDNTEHEAVAKMETDKDYTVTGRLQVTPIKDRLEALNTMYGGEPGKPVEEITLKDTTCIFNATIIYPETVILPGNLKASTTLTGADSLFQIEKITKDEAMHTVTVTMSLKESYNDFTKLYNDVKAIEDTLDLNIADVQVARDKVSNGDRIHFVGEVNGSFHGIATKNKTTKEFSFGFTAVQDPEGRDFTQSQEDTATIALTAEVAGIPEKIEQEFTLNGDLLLDDNTEHEAVAKMETDKDYTVTGRLQVTPIKDRLEALNTMYGGEPGKPVEDITLKDMTCIFNATISYPKTVILPGDLKASTTLTGADSLFQIEKITKDEAMHTVTVTMSLKESYNDFTKLYNDVKAIEDTLDLNIAGVQIARDKVSNGDRIHFVGEVNGSFHGIATKNETTKEFSFGFTAVQDPEGRDFTQGQEDTATIALTAEVEEKETPTNPDEPEPHNEEPGKPDVNKPSKDGTKSTNKPSSNTKSTNTGLQIFTASWVVLNVAALTAIINLKRRQKRNHTK
ncbi:hypothetical protein ACTQX5_02855 [Faecalicoccus sp. LCP19S3_E3]|uniref:hypothetical protein n=1 Tax=unclassified Faecalicoccus TaxID=2643311 RepID=UPI003F930C5B